MEKLDLKREYKEFYNPSAKTISVVNVPAMNFLMVDGAGDPNVAQAYKDAVEALYAVSYALKFKIKRAQSVDYVVMPLEGLWWVDDMSKFTVLDKAAWKWTMMIMQPEPVTTKLTRQAMDEVAKKKELAALSHVRFEKFTPRKFSISARMRMKDRRFKKFTRTFTARDISYTASTTRFISATRARPRRQN